MTTLGRTKLVLSRAKAEHWRALLVLFFVALLGLVVFLQPDERGAIRRIRPEERLELFNDARRNAEALCARAGNDEALVDRCNESASFLGAFPECDQGCQAFVRAHQRRPTR